MSNPISESFERLIHKNYMRSHSQERPFPLNGSEWARLVNERIEREREARCACQSCLNFLTRLHSLETPLKPERKCARRAMHHWFLQGQPTYDSTFVDGHSPAKESIQRLEDLGYSGSDLVDAEKQWLRSNVKVAKTLLVEGVKSSQTVDELSAIINPVLVSPGKKKMEDSDAEAVEEYWATDSSDYYESRPQAHLPVFPAASESDADSSK